MVTMPFFQQQTVICNHYLQPFTYEHILRDALTPTFYENDMDVQGPVSKTLIMIKPTSSYAVKEIQGDSKLWVPSVDLHM